MPEGQFKNSRLHCFRAKQLRKQASPAEQKLWSALQQLKIQTGLKFRRQHPVAPYILDFGHVGTKLAIELDGMSHDSRQGYDSQRTLFLEKQGWTVIRFANDEVLKNLEGVISAILVKIGKRTAFNI